MTTLILVRHGESEANQLGRFAGHTDFDLSQRGRQQAELTAQYIAENFQVDAAYASDLKRAFNTGVPAAKRMGLALVPDRRLREINAGVWEGKTFDEIAAQYSEDYSIWLSDLGRARCTQGERVLELADRILRCLTELAQAHEGKTLALFTHATPIRAMLTLWQYGDIAAMQQVKWPTNASVTVAQYEQGKFTLQMVSHDEHLKELRTKLPSNV